MLSTAIFNYFILNPMVEVDQNKYKSMVVKRSS